MKQFIIILSVFFGMLCDIHAADSLEVCIKVLDVNGESFAGVPVDLEGKSGKTDTDGLFRCKILKQSDWSMHRGAAYPSGYPYREFSFREEDAGQEIVVSFDDCVRVSAKIDGVYKPGDVTQGSVRGMCYAGSYSYSMVCSPDTTSGNAELWTCLPPTDSYSFIELKGTSYLSEEFFYVKKLQGLTESTSFSLSLQHDLLKVNIRLADSTPKFGQYSVYNKETRQLVADGTVQDEKNILLPFGEYELFYACSYSDEVTDKIYSDISHISADEKQANVVFDVNPADYRRIQVAINNYPAEVAGKLYGEFYGDNPYVYYGEERLDIKDEYTLYLKEGRYFCKVFSYGSERELFEFSHTDTLLVGDADARIELDYSDFIMVPFGVRMDNPSDDIYIACTISGNNGIGAITDSGKSSVWKSHALLKKGATYTIQAWTKGYHSYCQEVTVDPQTELILVFDKPARVATLLVESLLAKGNSAQPAWICLDDSDEKQTDSSRQVYFYDVPYGTHTLTVKYTGIPQREVQIEIDPDNTSIINRPGDLFQDYLKTYEQYYIQIWADAETSDIDKPEGIDKLVYIRSDGESVVCQSADDTPFDYAIYDGRGLQMMSRQQVLSDKVSIRGWASGVYIIRLVAKNKVYTMKFVR